MKKISSKHIPILLWSMRQNIRLRFYRFSSIFQHWLEMLLFVCSHDCYVHKVLWLNLKFRSRAVLQLYRVFLTNLPFSYLWKLTQLLFLLSRSNNCFSDMCYLPYKIWTLFAIKTWLSLISGSVDLLPHFKLTKIMLYHVPIVWMYLSLMWYSFILVCIARQSISTFEF